jgi:hypothetical protein
METVSWLIVAGLLGWLIWCYLDTAHKLDELRAERADQIFLIEVPPLEHQGLSYLNDIGIRDHMVVLPDDRYKNVFHVRRRPGAWIE